MKNSVKIYRIIFVSVLFVFSCVTVFGQDLGSSNGLFRASNPKSKSTTPEKRSTPKTVSAKSTPKKQIVRKNRADREKRKLQLDASNH